MLSFVIAREIVFRSHITVCTPEAEVCAVSEVVLQIIPQLQVDRELRHKLVRPVLGCRNTHHSQWVVHFLIGTSHTWNCIVITIGITRNFIKITCTYYFSFTIINVWIFQFVIIRLCYIPICNSWSQCWSHIEGTAKHRAKLRIG